MKMKVIDSLKRRAALECIFEGDWSDDSVGQFFDELPTPPSLRGLFFPGIGHNRAKTSNQL